MLYGVLKHKRIIQRQNEIIWNEDKPSLNIYKLLKVFSATGAACITLVRKISSAWFPSLINCPRKIIPVWFDEHESRMIYLLLLLSPDLKFSDIFGIQNLF